MVRILALGSNSGGQLATGDLDDVHYMKKSIFADPAAVDQKTSEMWCVHGGGNHVFAWSKDGTRLFASGSNAEGELGMGKKVSPSVLAWTPVEFPGDRVIQVSCGWNHSVLLNDRGELFSAGSNDFGQLGTDSFGDKDGCWRPVLGPKDASDKTQCCKFVAVACGLRHSLAVTEDGQVYGWGANRCGQLGIASANKKASNVSRMVLVFEGLPPILSVACGRSHSLMLSRDRRTIFASGMDKHGQCGPSDHCQPVAGLWRKFASPHPVLKLCSGWEFGAVLLELLDQKQSTAGRIGAVAAWGRADHGQLAVPVQSDNKNYHRELACIPDLDDITDIACGSNHTVALRANGDILMWGWNEHGNAGDPALKDVSRPLRISSNDHHDLDCPVLAIGCGYGNSFAVV